MPEPRELQADDVLTADWLNALVAYVREGRVTVDPRSGLTMKRSVSAGTAIGRQETPEMWVKLTYVGPSGSYSWKEQVPATGGGWTDGNVAGYCSADTARGSVPADPAWDADGNATLTVGYITRACRDQAVGRITIQADHC